MKLEYEENGKSFKVDDIDEGQLLDRIAKLDGWNVPFLILEDRTGDYLQCAGEQDGLTVELRNNLGSRFLHFRIGKGDNSKSWVSIRCKVGPIQVLEHESLLMSDAVVLFQYYLQNREVHPGYIKRNITRELQ